MADYVGVKESVLTFGPSLSEHRIQISVIDDPALEYTESFTLSLSPSPTGGENGRVSFTQSEAIVSILDNDGESSPHKNTR